MTTRVYNCRADFQQSDRKRSQVRPPAHHGLRGFPLALVAAVVLVPLAGAAEGQVGWSAATATSVVILAICRVVDERAPWGGLALLTGLAAVFMPRDPFGAVGPVLFVATGLFAVLWFANRQQHESEWHDGRWISPLARQAQQRQGSQGEQRVSAVLADELPQDYVLINGLMLPRGSGDIDQLVIGPTGVFLLETKTMAGRIVCEPDGRWRRIKMGRGGGTYEAYIGDPVNQAQRNIHAVRTCLQRDLPHLYSGARLWIQGLLVFPHPRTELETQHSRIPALRLEDVSQYICRHVPHRRLQAGDVDAVLQALMMEARRPRIHLADTAQGVVELALVLPLIMAVLFGTVALTRIVHAHTALVAAVHEAARAGALAATPAEAEVRMRARLLDVAPGVGLQTESLQILVDASEFSRRPPRVTAAANYTVDLGNLPFLGWAPQPRVHAEHVEFVDPFRSGLSINALPGGRP